MRKAIACITLLGWVLLAGRAALAGGIAEKMGDINKPPDEKERPEKEGAGDPADPAPRKDQPKVQPTDDKKLERRIRKLERDLARMRRVTIGTVEPVDGLDEARKHVERMRAVLEKARKDLTVVDLEETKRLAEKKLAFDKEWGKHAEAIEAGKKPEGMSAVEWAALCDQYFEDRAAFQADFADSKRRLERRMRDRLRPFERAVREAERHYKLMQERYKDASPELRRLLARAMAWRSHKARMAACREALARYQELQADRKGSGKSRKDPIEKETIERTGYLLADALRRLVLRELMLSDATHEPSRDQLDKGLRMPDWMNEKDGLARQRAKVRWTAEQLRLAHRRLLEAEKEIDAADRARLDYLREDGATAAELKAAKAKLARTRAERIEDRRKVLDARKRRWHGELATAQTKLDRMEGKGPPPEPEGE